MDMNKYPSIIGEKYRQVLCHQEKWKLVSSLFPPEHEPERDPSCEKWFKSHSDIHPAREILIALDGHSQFSLNRQIYPVTPGTIFLFDTYEEHVRAYPPETGKSIHLWFYFIAQRIIVHLLSINRGRLESLRPGLILENAELYNIIDQGWSRLKKSTMAAELKRQKVVSLLSLLFLELIELDAAEQKIESGSESHQEIVIRLICRHIVNTSGKDLTVEKLAQMAGYSKFHFLRIFKKHTGQTIHDSINDARMQKITEMLDKKCLQKEIAETLGFSSPSTFSHWYHKHRKETHPSHSV